MPPTLPPSPSLTQQEQPTHLYTDVYNCFFPGQNTSGYSFDAFGNCNNCTFLVNEPLSCLRACSAQFSGYNNVATYIGPTHYATNVATYYVAPTRYSNTYYQYKCIAATCKINFVLTRGGCLRIPLSRYPPLTPEITRRKTLFAIITLIFGSVVVLWAATGLTVICMRRKTKKQAKEQHGSAPTTPL